METSEAGLDAIEKMIGELESIGLHDHSHDGSLHEEVEVQGTMRCLTLFELHERCSLDEYGWVSEVITDALESIRPLVRKLRQTREEMRIKDETAEKMVRAASEHGVRIVEWCRSQGIAIPDEVLYSKPNQ